MPLSLSKIPGYVGPNRAYTATKVARVDGPLKIKKKTNKSMKCIVQSRNYN